MILHKKTVFTLVFAALLFIFLLMFFIVEHPLYIYDSDDWTYISYSRHVWPSVSEWNPTRILPETLMPIAAQAGVSFIMPFTGDYIGSMAFAFAFVLAMLIVSYILSFGKLLYTQFIQSEKLVILLMTILFLLCFLPYMTSPLENEYLFYANSVTTYFYYIIPALLNGSVVLWMLSSVNHSLFKDTALLKASGIILCTYLSINSNMFQNIIIVTYAAAHLLYEAIWVYRKNFPGKKTLVAFAAKNFNQLFILCIWLISLFFESQGGRSTQLSSNHNINIFQTIGKFYESLHGIDKLYIFQLCCVILLSVFIAIISCKKARNNWKQCESEKQLLRLHIISFTACICTILYLILLCSLVNDEYILRTDCMISWIFWLFVAEAASLGYIIKRLPKSALTLPLVIFCLIFETFMHGSRYKDISYGEPDVLKEIDEYIIQQVLDAETSGQSYVEVHIPSYSDSSWPLNTDWGGERLSTTLYRHGITNSEMEIVFIPDPSVNEAFR